jgi:hypothetical protein
VTRESIVEVKFKCWVCHADPAGFNPALEPKMIFVDRYRKDKNGEPKYACRDDLSPEREKEIQAREAARGWRPGELR